MDLISAKVDAAANSKKSGKKVYIIADVEGEAVLRKSADLSEGETLMHVYSNGSEIAATSEETEVVKDEPKVKEEKQNKKVMAKKAVKKVAKKAAKKVVTKKEAPAKKVKEGPALIDRPTRIRLTEAQWKAFDKLEVKLQTWASELIAKKLS